PLDKWGIQIRVTESFSLESTEKVTVAGWQTSDRPKEDFCNQGVGRLTKRCICLAYSADRRSDEREKCGIALTRAKLPLPKRPELWRGDTIDDSQMNSVGVLKEET